MRWIIAILFSAVSVSAATLYGGPSASGGATGADFNNLVDFDTVTMVRGNTYVIIDGTYAARTFNVAESGTTTITVRKASAADSAVTGYASSLHDGEALFSTASNFVWDFLSNYWIIDGVHGTHKSAGSFGIRLFSTASRAALAGGALLRFNDQNTEYRTGVSISNIEGDWNNGTSLGSNEGTVAYWLSASGNIDCTFTHCYFHDSNAFGFYVGNSTFRPGTTNLVIDDVYFYKTGGGGGVDHHWEMIWATDWTNSIVKNSKFEDTYGSVDGQTGWFMLGGCNNVKITGNLFFCSVDCSTGNNGTIAAWSQDTYQNDGIYVINNTFVDLTSPKFNFDHASVSDTNIEFKNNIYYLATGTFTDLTTHAHGAFGGGISSNGTSAQTGLTTSIFSNYAGDVFTLASATTAGDSSIGSDYETDANGLTRGEDGTWDRGAFEFVEGGGSSGGGAGTTLSGGITISGGVTIQ